MKTRTSLLWLYATLALLFVLSSHAQQDDSSGSVLAEDIDVFVAATKLTAPELKFPNTISAHRKEAWIDIAFMVDAKGKVHEPVVLDYSGGREFLPVARRHLGRTLYEPATLDGVPVESSHSMRYRFKLIGYRNSTKKFYYPYQRLIKAIQAGNEKKAKGLFNKLEQHVERLLHEDAFLNIAYFYFEQKYGTEETQTYYLKRVLTGDDQEEYVSPEQFIPLLANLFKLQVKTSDYQGAVDTYNRLVEREDAAHLVESFKTVVDQIRTYKFNDGAYKIGASIEDTGHWHYSLFKSGFSFANVSGEIAELKLRCERKFVFFEYLKDKAYHIPESYGNCELQVIGEPESKFELVQFKSIEKDKITVQ